MPLLILVSMNFTALHRSVGAEPGPLTDELLDAAVAAGALEAVLTLAALRNGTVPASPGFFTIDPEIGFAPTQSALAASSPFALSTSLGFGGGNAALVLGRVKP